MSSKLENNKFSIYSNSRKKGNNNKSHNQLKLHLTTLREKQ